MLPGWMNETSSHSLSFANQLDMVIRTEHSQLKSEPCRGENSKVFTAFVRLLSLELLLISTMRDAQPASMARA